MSGAAGSSPRTWGRRFSPFVKLRKRRFIPTHVGQTCPASPAPRRSAVHPHARGADSLCGSGRCTYGGSSPRTWGRPRRRERPGQPERFIPTHVGQTAGAGSPETTRAVHPHARGADIPATEQGRPNTGSSPRTWGRLQQILAAIRRIRFIPTHVGQTPRPMTQRSTGPVHPHARGADLSVRASSSQMVGSSPRTWGRHPGVREKPRPQRFIPTHVGQTCLP